MKREVDKLNDTIMYEVLIELIGFAEEGDKLKGCFIKKNIPFDVSRHQGHAEFFKPLSTSQN